MEFEHLINEVELATKDTKLNVLFDSYLKQIFSPAFYRIIDSYFKTRIKFKETVDKNRNVVAWTIGNVIYINTPVFYAKNSNKAILFVLHEFIHILQNSKSFLLVDRFGNIKELEHKLYNLIKPNLTKSFSKFLTNTEQSLHSSTKDEVLSYQMNNSVDWTAVKSGTREAYKKLLIESGLFNLNSPFWKKRL